MRRMTTCTQQPYSSYEFSAPGWPVTGELRYSAVAYDAGWCFWVTPFWNPAISLQQALRLTEAWQDA